MLLAPRSDLVRESHEVRWEALARLKGMIDERSFDGLEFYE